MGRDRRRRTRWRAGWLLAAGLLAGVAGVLFEVQVRPMVRTIAEGHIRLEVTRLLNQALGQEDAWQTDSPLLQVERNDQGEVTAVQTDMAQMNQVRARITQELAGLLRQYTQQGISIPAGTLTGSQILTGRGPRVPFVVEPVGDVVTQVYHSFDQAGINQTRYQVMLQVTVQVEAICPGCTVHTQVSSSICLGETVIVGRVPEAFTQVETKDTIPGLVADYGA